MKKILHISKYYYPYMGGTEHMARMCVNALKDEYEQQVICFNNCNKNITSEVDGIKVVRVGCITKISSQPISLYYAQILKNEFETFNPDIVIFHYPNPFVARYLLKYIPDSAKLILYWHLDIVKQKILRLFFIKQNINLINRASRLIASSKNYVDGSPWLQKVKDKVTVISNCIDENKLICNEKILSRAKEIKEANIGKIICFAFGRHTAYKGLYYLIKASHLLNDRFRVFIAGKGEETQKLVKEAQDDKKITLLGQIDEDELKAYLLATDIFCFPSIQKNEAFGIALAEAMFFENPAVTFTIEGSGVNYVNLNGESGIEVPNKDYKAYAEALIALSENKNQLTQMGMAAKRRVNQLFSYQKYKSSICELLKSI